MLDTIELKNNYFTSANYFESLINILTYIQIFFLL